MILFTNLLILWMFFFFFWLSNVLFMSVVVVVFFLARFVFVFSYILHIQFCIYTQALEQKHQYTCSFMQLSKQPIMWQQSDAPHTRMEKTMWFQWLTLNISEYLKLWARQSAAAKGNIGFNLFQTTEEFLMLNWVQAQPNWTDKDWKTAWSYVCWFQLWYAYGWVAQTAWIYGP